MTNNAGDTQTENYAQNPNFKRPGKARLYWLFVSHIFPEPTAFLNFCFSVCGVLTFSSEILRKVVVVVTYTYRAFDSNLIMCEGLINIVLFCDSAHRNEQ